VAPEVINRAFIVCAVVLTGGLVRFGLFASRILGMCSRAALDGPVPVNEFSFTVAIPQVLLVMRDSVRDLAVYSVGMGFHGLDCLYIYNVPSIRVAFLGVHNRGLAPVTNFPFTAGILRLHLVMRDAAGGPVLLGPSRAFLQKNLVDLHHWQVAF